MRIVFIYHYPFWLYYLINHLVQYKLGSAHNFTYSIVIIQLKVQHPMTFNLLCCEIDESSKYSNITSWCLKMWGIFARNVTQTVYQLSKYLLRSAMLMNLLMNHFSSCKDTIMVPIIKLFIGRASSVELVYLCNVLIWLHISVMYFYFTYSN